MHAGEGARMADALMNMKPPFRADHVGSFMRPPELLEARRQLNAGAITGEQLRAVEDTCIRAVVAMQERVGIPSVTDGEFRRNSWRDNFFERTDGYSKDKVQSSFFFTEFDGTVHRGGSAPVAVDRLKRRDPITADEFEALLPVVSRGIAKATIPSPTVNHFFTGDPGLTHGPYRGDRLAYFADIIPIYQQEIGALYAAGCRYLQVDEVPLAVLCDPKNQDIVRQRGEDPIELIRQYGELISAVVRDRPADLAVAVHMCRGNAGHGQASGGYEPLAEPVFSRLPVDGYLLEYDTARAGGFEPLQAIPSVAVLGLLSTKLAALEPLDEIRRKIDDAAKFVPMDRLGLCPQCGFSSGAGVSIGSAGATTVAAAAGAVARVHRMSFDEQERKLAHVVELSARIWS
jgi:5-methyltetrahydropteroyltriglutamate--homocysteine methyltransferase